MTPLHIVRPGSSGRARSRREAGTTLLELLVASCLFLLVLSMMGTLLPGVLDVAFAVPEAVDLHQRVRAAEAVVRAVVHDAGAGADLLGAGPLSHAVPAIWPRRIGSSADPPGTAWGDRFTALTTAFGAAQAPLALPVAVGSTEVRLAWHPACGTHASCGFARGDRVLVYGRSGALALAEVSALAGLVLTVGPALDQAVSLPAVAVVVTSSTLAFDAARRQLRRADNAAASQPFVDEVVAMRVRYYGSPAPPRWPTVPGEETCATTAAGLPKLGMLGTVPGPPVELPLADLSDGPWCGTGTWTFDADLLRVQAVRVSLRLQATSPGARGPSLLWFLNPGSARRPAQEVRDVETDIFVVSPNLAFTS